MSLSFNSWFKPTDCPGNFDEGPQIFAFFVFLDNPLRIFSATCSTVEEVFVIRGFEFFGSGFFGSFV